MRHYKKYNLFGWLSVLTLMLTTACTSVDDFEQQGKRAVTFIIQQESQAGGTRADEKQPAPTGTIGRATKVDVLIYAVYEKQGDGPYMITKNKDLIKGSTVNDFDVETGQNAIDYANHESPTKITLLLEGNKTYKVAFWAQNKDSKAFDTRNLEKVEVKYEKTEGNKKVNFLNNDELRDAFCAVSDDITDDGRTHTITLRRPLAQINVGTAGWDYEGAAILRPSAVGYTKSKITLKGVARYYNVLEGKTLEQNELTNDEQATTDVTFDYGTIPAFMNITQEQWDKKSEKYKPFKPEEGKEEFLIVDLDGKDGIIGYKNYEDYLNAKKSMLSAGKDFSINDETLNTETFKYLSMCYVLVPEAFVSPAVGNTQNTSENVTSGAVLSEVEFTTKGDEIVNEDGTTANEIMKSFNIKNVPVQKNWRTNILGRGFFIGATGYKLYIVPDYRGDYDNVNGGWLNGDVNKGNTDEDEWKWKGDGNPNESPKFPNEDDYYSNSSDKSGEENTPGDDNNK